MTPNETVLPADEAAPPAVEVTLTVDAETYRRFERVRAAWEQEAGAAPNIGWLMSFALLLADPEAAAATADRLALDHLCESFPSS